MALLIVLSRSSFDANYGTVLEIASKVSMMGEKVGLLLIQDACILSTLDECIDKTMQHKLKAYVLKADCEARGLLDKVAKGIEIIGYRRWVKLVMEDYDKIMSWG